MGTVADTSTGVDLFFARVLAGGCGRIPLSSICSPASLFVTDNRLNLATAIRAPKITMMGGLTFSGGVEGWIWCISEYPICRGLMDDMKGRSTPAPGGGTAVENTRRIRGCGRSGPS
ncbi:hypothetical protein THAOC_33626 [Thalassiosira oceanica]|uniref:Uncharacterized protein n=1 Tax=Thalassiosira oceanica TaxID=159749 RepID=K0R6S5_THAOC|nr:hypothetical protein THAOC_33626 [Thalassiosira oceanica]|eukprot:EJK47639.1 hypothetical protein THAOC_33626 [Thalassiosira oceanica]